MSTRHRPGTLLVLALLVLTGVSAGSASGQEAVPDAQGTFWLAAGETDSVAGSRPFTTFPPTANDTTDEVPLRQSRIAEAEADWTIPSPVAPWTLDAGSEVEAVVWLDGLDALVPAYDPRNGGAAGDIEVVLSVWSGAQTRGDADALDGGASPLGEARASWSYAEVPAGPTEVRLALPIASAHTFDPNSTANDSKFQFRIEVHGGRGTEGSPIEVLVGSTDHPSHIVVPGAPWATMRAAEAAMRAEEACRARVVQGLPCADGPPEAGPTTERESPVPGILPLVVGGLLVALWTRRPFDNRKRRRDQSPDRCTRDGS